MGKVGLVLEGGAMRGMYTVGVLDVMMDNNIEVDCIVGTSAGALFGPNYFSKQRRRAPEYRKRALSDKKKRMVKLLKEIVKILEKNYGEMPIIYTNYETYNLYIK